VDDDWAVPVPDLELSAIGVMAHAAEVCLWYAIDLAARGNDLHLVEHRVKTDGSPADALAVVTAYASLVADVIDAAPASARGFHPMGAADPSGFAAMTCDELLIHSDDAGRALGRAFQPPPDLAEPVLRRLFPWVTPGADPWQQLRWANGRIQLEDQPRLDGWAWHCAPLDEWDGTVATRQGRA
jgi:hypothetical protein